MAVRSVCCLSPLPILLMLPSLCWSADINETKFDCDMKSLAVQFAHKIQPWRTPNDLLFTQIHDALQLSQDCDTLRPPTTVNHSLESEQPHSDRTKFDRELQETIANRTEPNFCTVQWPCIFVSPSNALAQDQTMDGSIRFPLSSPNEAITLSRSMSKPLSIVLLEGIHTLSDTLVLGPQESGITLRSYPGEEVWLSGGIPLNHYVKWKASAQNPRIMVANLANILHNQQIPKVTSLFSKNRRWIRARYPNSDPEINQWGEYAPDNDKYSITGALVTEWIRPPKGELPTYDYFDFATDPPPGVPIKNSSVIDGYNLYASGKGGVCADLWGDGVDSYWCANASDGGGADIDRECALTGHLQIPVGMTYNQTDPIGQRISAYRNATGAFIHAWHSRSWAMHMFQVKEHNAMDGRFDFTKGSGSQGGRNWCRCDQCPDARSWCGQNMDPPNNDDDRLLGGDWIIENVWEELDSPGEFYFEPTSMNLYVFLNHSLPDALDFRFAVLETLIRIEGAANVEIRDIGFRDTPPTFMGLWQAPSGGDWALHRGGAVFIENTTSVLVRGNTFRRLDGNAVFISRRNRDVRLKRNTFEWLGENAIATWGDTDAFNATEENFPLGTAIVGNVMRELGIFQKQSSAVALAKSAKTLIKNNIIFNMGRAGINFNDGLGGGDMVKNNLLFNTCRESGDHGPINSWDRQPFLTTVRYGYPSFIPLVRTITKNFMIANYGSDQAVDNDDGSSYFHVHHNVWYDSGGVKCDWGGHDSIYEHNFITSYPDRWNEDCVGFFARFQEGHGHIVQNNICIVPDSDTTSISLDDCQGTNAVLQNNSYYSPNGAIGIYCYDSEGDDSYDQTEYTLERGQELFGLETGTVARPTPPEAELVSWAKHLLW